MYELQRYRKVTFAIITGLLLFGSFFVALPFWSAIAWGTTLGILSFPLHKRLRGKLGAGTSALLTTVIVILAVTVPLTLIGFSLTNEVKQIRSALETKNGSSAISLSKAADDVNSRVAPILSAFGVEEFDVRELANRFVQPAVSTAPKLIERAFKGIVIVIFAFILLFFVLRDGHRLHDPVLELLPLPRERSEQLLSGLYNTLHATFQGILFVAAIQGFLLGVVFWALGLPAPTLAGLFGFILCMIPFAGAPVLWVPSALMLALQDKWVHAIILVASGVLVIGLVDNILRPIIIGARTKLHTAAVFFAIISGIFSLGSIGLFLGPLLVTTVLGVMEVLRESKPDPVEAAE